jgi:CO/xanthine dehydrogenase Mo-binding subunit
MAIDTVRCVGEPVAAVIAETEEAAEAGVDAVVVDYEELPLVLDGEQALERDAPALAQDDADVSQSRVSSRTDVPPASARLRSISAIRF